MTRWMVGCVFALGVTANLHAQVPPLPDDSYATNTPPTPEQIEAVYQAWLSHLATNRLAFEPWLAAPMMLSNGQPANRETTEALATANLLALVEEFSANYENLLANAASLGVPTELELPNGEKAILSSLEGGEPVWNMHDSMTQAVSIATAPVWPNGGAGFSLTGTNTLVGQWEAGGIPRLTHAEFQGRVSAGDGTTNIDAHATGVASVLGAAGLYNLVIGNVTNVQGAKGMSYAAPICSYLATNDTAKMAGAAATNGLRVSNHSYSARCGWQWGGAWFWFGNSNVSQTVDWKFGAYTIEAYSIDTNVYTARTYLPVWTPGNSRSEGPPVQPTNHYYVPPGSQSGYLVTGVSRSTDGGIGGYDSIHPQGNAKNTLTVGAVSNLPGGYTGPAGVQLGPFSPFGPTDDGRLKPDVVAPGVDIPMASSTSDSAFQLASGTSFAAPAISGSINLLNQLRSSLHMNSRPWLASTMKALVIHTTDEAGDYPGPDYRFGWGLMNTRRAAELVRNNATNGWKCFIKEVFLKDGDHVICPVPFAAGQTGKVTIVWTDPAGPVQTNPVVDSTTPRLVNDLDLRIVSPSGVTNFPYVLNPDLAIQNAATRAAAASTADDALNNVEQAVVNNTAAGSYTVLVTHKASLGTNGQWLTLVVSGNQVQTKPELCITSLAQTGTNKVSFAWPSVVGQLYQVQYRNNLESGNWNNWDGEISATKTTTAVEVDMSGPDGRRFYRVLEIE